jgi:murein DD-endopeptidase MepM/ murein hydrolase activator NlpD
MNRMKTGVLLYLILTVLSGAAQNYPQNYFRNPLAVPMQLVANFGELRANHWHMGLDIRTQQRENLPVYAAADGYIATVSVDATGFGRAIYINHPNGLTTVYAHLNAFEPRLNEWLKAQQYAKQSWAGKWDLSADLFLVKQGDFIAYSGNTGGSQGPHVHFEIRDTKTDKCLNPLLFNFPIRDMVPPTLQRLALYDRNRSVLSQTPRLLGLKKAGANYTLTTPVLKVASDKISFAIGAIDRFLNSGNGNGIYSAQVFVDDVWHSGFVLDSIPYDETRYLNAHIDYRYKAAGGPYLQHLSPLPGERSSVYKPAPANGVVHISDTLQHAVMIEVADAAGNRSQLRFKIKYEPHFFKTPYTPAADQLRPGEVNVFERENFELYTSEWAAYDTINATYSTTEAASAESAGPVHLFLGATIPTHDSVTVRLKIANSLSEEDRDRVIIFGTSGSRQVVEKGAWNQGWVHAKFRQFGAYQAFVDKTPPTINAPGVGDTIDLRRAARLVFQPKDNFKKIKTFRAEVDGQWLLCSNDKGLSYTYQFDAYFLPGVRQLQVTVEDVAGNRTEKTWWVRR